MFMKILIKIAILLVIVIGGGAFYGWLQWEPIAAELSAKDQEKFDLMMVEAKAFGFGTAQKNCVADYNRRRSVLQVGYFESSFAGRNMTSMDSTTWPLASSIRRAAR